MGGYKILFDEEINVVEVQYEGVNAALLAELNVRLTNLENEFAIAIDGVDGQLGSLEDDMNSLMTLVQAQSSALTNEIDTREQADISMNESFSTELVNQQQEYSEMIEHEAEMRAQAILDEATARGAAIAESEAIIMTDVAILATTVEGLATEMGAAQASIIEVNDALVTETMARTAQYTAMQSDFEDTNAAILEESVTRADADEALAYQISIIEASVGDNYAAILAEQTARVNADNALSSQITTLSATVGSNTAAISAEATARASADGNIEAKYSVKVDVNGHVAGFGLIATANNDLSHSLFVIDADSFQVFNGATALPPFEVTGGIVYMQNVRIVNAVIENLTLGTEKINYGQITSLNLVSYSSSDAQPADVGISAVYAAFAGGVTGANVVVDWWCQGQSVANVFFFFYRDGVISGGHQVLYPTYPSPAYVIRYVETDPENPHTYEIITESFGNGHTISQRGILITEFKR